MMPILVLGIGNILLRDEGVGVRVVEHLLARRLPPQVEVIDGGTAGADLVDLIADRRRLIVIDAIQAGILPGSILRLRPEQLIPNESQLLSLHQVGLLKSLDMADKLRCLPQEICIFGIQPGDLSPGLDLTRDVAKAVPHVAAMVLNEASYRHQETNTDALAF